jgi:hypothetical protein
LVREIVHGADGDIAAHGGHLAGRENAFAFPGSNFLGPVI